MKFLLRTIFMGLATGALCLFSAILVWGGATPLLFVPIAVIVLLLTAVASFFVAWPLQKRLNQLESYLRRAARRGFSELLTVNPKKKDEISHIMRLVNALALSRAGSEAALVQLNADLEQKVRERSEELLEKERLAYLGSLVGGVSHDLNSPLGVSITAVDFLKNQLRTLDGAFSNGTLSRSDFERVLGELREGMEIIDLNLKRATDLILSFKSFSVEQSRMECNEFVLDEFLNQIVLSLKPRLRATGHRIELKCPPSIMCRTYPGALAQICSNLIENAIFHGFEGMQERTIKIEVTAPESGGSIVMSCTDNGLGIASEDLQKIFDPYFTTKKGRGGTGFGLHIVSTMVSAYLRGNIVVESVPGQGTRFLITFPSRIENEAENDVRVPNT